MTLVEYATAGTIVLGFAGLAGRVMWRIRKAVLRIEAVIPTVTVIAETFPKSTLAERLTDVERALDNQSQFLVGAVKDMAQESARTQTEIAEIRRLIEQGKNQ